MKLIELYELVNDSLNIEIVNEDYELIGRYNGKDSIDEKYNEHNVVYLQPDWDRKYLVVEIN